MNKMSVWEDMTQGWDNFGLKTKDWTPFFYQVGFLPSVNTYTKDGKFCVDAELPGVDKGDISVSIEDGSLIISGEKKEIKENYTWKEARYGSFTRVVSLPREATGQAEAEFKDGVLHVAIGMEEGGKQIKKVEVK